MARLDSGDLALRCDPTRFSFRTTDELEDLTGVIGQPRATEALRLAMGTRRPGYNLFAAGSQGSGRHAMVRAFLLERAAGEAVPDDVCYVQNFSDPARPRALRLPAGAGPALAADMDEFVEDLGTALPAAFESDSFRLQRQALDDEFEERRERLFSEVRERARSRGFEVMRAPAGLMFAPRVDGNVLGPEEFSRLSPEERERLQGEMEDLQKESQDLLRQVPAWEREHGDRLRQLSRQVTAQAVDSLIERLRRRHTEIAGVGALLDAVREDVVQNFRPMQSQDGEDGRPSGDGLSLARRYRVNVLVSHGDKKGAPVVYEDNPGFAALLGRSEHRAEMGALLTDFSLLRGGALHRANGGYLVLDAHKVLGQPLAWEGLKRALRSNELRIENPAQLQGMPSTVSLEPEPVPLDLKIILIGDHGLYYMLKGADPDFDDLFKVVADLDDRMPRSDETLEDYPRLLAMLARRHDLLPLDASAVARMIDHSARSTGDREWLTTRVRDLVEVLTEANYSASGSGRPTITGEDVQGAVEARRFREGRIRERMQQQILRGTVLISTDGEQIGQINGLAVLQVGGSAFGRPSRITARVRIGDGEVVDIEREVELSGPSHSKGVLILSSFLAGRYATERPLSLSASLVFEQSYSGVDGDSASSAELYALLSAIARVPIRQSFAVTGSVNQLGQVQAIGGANEKVEGFFDLCQERGLSGEQGVLIPAANVQNLMLRDDVVEAVESGRFGVYAVSTIDEGVALLTGLDAGQPDDAGQYPPDSVNGRVQRRLQEMAERREAQIAAARGRANS